LEERAQDESANRAVLSPLRATFRLPFREADLLLPRHRGIFTVYASLKRKKEAGTLTGWRVGLLERLERLIQQERAKVEAELAEKRRQQEGGEAQ